MGFLRHPNLRDFELFRDPEQAAQALWCFEMRDADNPAVTLGQELQLHLIELHKADRLRLAPGPLAPWIALFERWQEDDTMSQITEEPARAVLDKHRNLSADEETRWLAFARERALYDEWTLIVEARAEGRAEGEDAAMHRTAINMVRRTTLDDAAIAGITGLAVADIAAMRAASA